MPHEGPPVFRSAHAVYGTDFSQAKVRSTTQRQRPRPLPCSVLRYAEAIRQGLRERSHNHGHLTRSQDDGAVVPTFPARPERHQPRQALVRIDPCGGDQRWSSLSRQ